MIAVGGGTDIEGLKQKLASMLIVVGLISTGFVFALVAEAQIRIMPLGDSITEGVYGSSLNIGYRRPLYLSLTAAGCDVNFVGGMAAGIPTDFDRDHEGHSGWRADQIRDNVYDWLNNNPADIVLLHIGTNDITGGNEDVAEVNDILNEIDEYSQDITVVLAARIILRNDTKNPQTIAFNDAVEAMAAERITNGDDIIIVDMEDALTYPDDLADAVHPNDSGYNKMADVWYDALIDYFTPVITSTPIANGTVGTLYTYDVNATAYPDPNYILLEYPPGMTIDSDTGLIQWNPPSGNSYHVSVEARNDIADTNQSFTITIPTIIEFDAASSDSNDINGTTLRWSHTIGSGDNRILVVGTQGKDKSDSNLIINTVTYNDVPMMPVENSAIMAGTGIGNDLRIKTEMYYLLDNNLPLTGIYDVNVTYSANVKLRCAGAISLRNVDQKPAEAASTNSNENSDTISTNITTLTDGSWLIDVVGCNNKGFFDANESDNQIEQFDVNTIDSTAAGSTKPVASPESTAMSWTFSSGAGWMTHSVAAFAPKKMLVISGYIENSCNVPTAGDVVNANNGGGSDVTDANGFYEVWVDYNWSGTVTPTKNNYSFDPNWTAYTDVLDDWVDQDYDANCIYDLDCDGSIGFGDVAIICENWLDGPDLPGDFYKDEDDIINFLDFADFANVWED